MNQRYCIDEIRFSELTSKIEKRSNENIAFEHGIYLTLAVG